MYKGLKKIIVFYENIRVLQKPVLKLIPCHLSLKQYLYAFIVTFTFLCFFLFLFFLTALLTITHVTYSKLNSQEKNEIYVQSDLK